MPESWEQIWRELCDELARQPHCPDHDYPCVRTLRDRIVNDIVRVDESGILVRSHHPRSQGERLLRSRDFQAWWNDLQKYGSVSIDPGESPRSQNSVLVGSILAICLPSRVIYDGSHTLTLLSRVQRLKDGWGYRLGTGAAAIDAVLLGADGPLTEQRIVQLVKDRGLKERVAVANHLRELVRQGLITKVPDGFVRTRETEFPVCRLVAEDADDDASSEVVSYTPENVDRRPIVERQIRERRGQQQFRESLRGWYGNQCVVTGCRVLAVLDHNQACSPSLAV